MRVGVTTAAAALASSGLYAAGPPPADTCSSGQCADGAGGSARLAVWGPDGLLAQLGIAAKDAAVMLTQDYHNADGSVNPYPVIVSSTQFLQVKCPGTILEQEAPDHVSQVFHRGPWPDGMSCPKVLMNLGNVLKELCSTLDCDRPTFAAAFRGAVTSFRLARGQHADDAQRDPGDVPFLTTVILIASEGPVGGVDKRAMRRQLDILGSRDGPCVAR